MQRLTRIVGLAVMISACGPPDEAVQTAEAAARIANDKCQKTAMGSEWRAERVGEDWIARFGEPDARGHWRLTARIKALDGKAVCDVSLPWSKS